jgi:hypothetical protein
VFDHNGPYMNRIVYTQSPFRLVGYFSGIAYVTLLVVYGFSIKMGRISNTAIIPSFGLSLV